jgi:hypothetical protein
MESQRSLIVTELKTLHIPNVLCTIISDYCMELTSAKLVNAIQLHNFISIRQYDPMHITANNDHVFISHKQHIYKVIDNEVIHYREAADYICDMILLKNPSTKITNKRNFSTKFEQSDNEGVFTTKLLISYYYGRHTRINMLDTLTKKIKEIARIKHKTVSISTCDDLVYIFIGNGRQRVYVYSAISLQFINKYYIYTYSSESLRCTNKIYGNNCYYSCDNLNDIMIFDSKTGRNTNQIKHELLMNDTDTQNNCRYILTNFYILVDSIRICI